MCVSGVHDFKIIDHDRCWLSEQALQTCCRKCISPVFPNGNNVFQQDNVMSHNVQILLKQFQERNAEFQLMIVSPNSSDLNTIEHN